MKVSPTKLYEIKNGLEMNSFGNTEVKPIRKVGGSNPTTANTERERMVENWNENELEKKLKEKDFTLQERGGGVESEKESVNEMQEVD